LPSNNINYILNEVLATQDAETLAIVRNEIYARHGYILKNEKCKNYFNSQSWYSPNPNFTEKLLNRV